MPPALIGSVRPEDVTDSESEIVPAGKSSSRAAAPSQPKPRRKLRTQKAKATSEQSQVIWHGETGCNPHLKLLSDGEALPTPSANVRSTLEVFSGSGNLSQSLRKMGYNTSEIDLALDPGDDIHNPRMPDLLAAEATATNVVYTHIAPPCNGFTIARFPQLRRLGENKVNDQKSMHTKTRSENVSFSSSFVSS